MKSVLAQLPSNDFDWEPTPYWSDEFSGTTLDLTKWKPAMPWEDLSAPLYRPDLNAYSISSTDGSDIRVGNGTLTLISRKLANYVPKKVTEYDNATNTYPVKTEQIIYTTANLSTFTNFGYGYYEAAFWLRNDFSENNFGNFFDIAWWLGVNNSQLNNIDYNEIDFCEIVSQPPYSTNSLNYQPNVHVRVPYGEESDEAQFILNKTDPSTNHQYFINKFYHYYLPHDTWITIGCEWLPNQIKFYINGKLWYRLESQYLFSSSLGTFSPMANLILPMPMILGIGYNGLKSAPIGSEATYELYVDYVRYYRLKKDAAANYINHNATDLCPIYSQTLHKVYSQIYLGQAGCSTCAIGPTTCRRSLRATDIKLEDGFYVPQEAEIYISDCDPTKIP